MKNNYLNAELDYWIKRKNYIFNNYGLILNNRKNDTAKIKNNLLYNYNFDNKVALDLGVGVWGLINYLPFKYKIGIDPLITELYKEYYKFYDPVLKLLNSSGENIPIKSESINMIIVENVLDHILDINLIFNEMYRILKPNGHLLGVVNTYPTYLKILKRFKENITGKYDKHHPHFLTITNINHHLKENNFIIKNCFTEEFPYMPSLLINKYIINIFGGLKRYYFLAEK